jgi:hypothetical protein
VRSKTGQTIIDKILNKTSYPDFQNPLWWTPEHIKEIVDKIHSPKVGHRIFGTTWTIPLDAIKKYKISFEETPRPVVGGGIHKTHKTHKTHETHEKRIQRILKHATWNHVNAHGIQR